MKSVLVSAALWAVLVVGVPTVGAQGPDGQALYKQNCAACHGATGAPAPAMAKALNIPTFDAAFIGKVSADSMIAVLKNGSGKNMKSFKEKLSAEQMTAVIKYVRGTFGK